MTIRDFDIHVRETFAIEELKKIDAGFNGLQVGDYSAEITRVAVAVDASMETFRRAAEWGAQLLFVHHGIMWGSQFPVTGAEFDRIRFLIENKIALYAVHLPLDMHPSLGNNAGLAAQLKLTDVSPFGQYKGIAIGCKGVLPTPMRIDEVGLRLFGDERGTLGRLPFGKDFNTTVAIVSGGGTSCVDEAIAQGIDLFVTGDADHVIYHRCLEAGINVIFGGHYQTETWGVSLFGKHLTSRFGMETFFIDVPTGL